MRGNYGDPIEEDYDDLDRLFEQRFDERFEPDLPDYDVLDYTDDEEEGLC